MSTRWMVMSTNKFASLRNIKAIVPASAMSGGCATSQAAPLSLWATKPSGAAKQHAVPPTAATPRAVSVISRRSSSKSFFRGSSGNKSFSWSKPSSHEARRRREVKDETAANNPLLNDDTAELADHLADVKPLDFDMASRIEGQESQMVSFELEPGQVVRAEAGNLVYMEDGIEMDTSTGGGASSMVITGQNMFVTDYVNRGSANSKVGLGTDIPSKIIRLSLAAYGGEVICQRGAFLAGSHTIDIQTEFTKLMAGFFGGEGFVLQRLTGEGDAFVKASGPLIRRELEEGESLRVSSGSVVAFAPSVEYDVQTVPGFKNVVFGGTGLFITKLTG
eukprot:jgi/Undpi1/10708/HiC_scaffold_29.g13156.m1